MLARRWLWVLLGAMTGGAGFWACGAEGEGGTSSVGGNGGSSTSSTTSTTSSSTTNTEPSMLGLGCGDDTPCGEGGLCILPTASVAAFAEFFGDDQAGGPAGGYCSRVCNDDEQCAPYGGLCLGTAPEGFCARGCTFGEPALTGPGDPVPSDKCQGRDDLMCAPVASGGAICVPACGSDEQCPSPRYCDTRVGLCVDVPRQGASLGAACVPDQPATPGDEDTCAGLCLELLDSQNQAQGHMCSARCSLGGALGETHDCGGPTLGLCVLEPALGPDFSAGVEDVGFCAAACPTHGACNYLERILCFDLGQLGTFGVGYCMPATACPSGNECGGDEMCVLTANGPACVQFDPENTSDPLFPLDEAAGGAAGAAGAGGASGGGGAGGST